MSMLNDEIIRDEIEVLEKRYKMSSKDFKEYVGMTREYPPHMDEVDAAFWLSLLTMK